MWNIDPCEADRCEPDTHKGCHYITAGNVVTSLVGVRLAPVRLVGIQAPVSTGLTLSRDEGRLR
jgi:hypothetical protein